MFVRWVDANGICLCFGLLVFSLLPVDLVHGGMFVFVVCVYGCIW